jgi:hypothetical protein
MITSVIAFMAAAMASASDGGTSQPAAAPAAPAAPAAAPAPKGKNDPDKVVCRTILPTGTRLGGTRVCHTQAEWADITRDSQRTTESAQVHGFQGGARGN